MGGREGLLATLLQQVVLDGGGGAISDVSWADDCTGNQRRKRIEIHSLTLTRKRENVP